MRRPDFTMFRQLAARLPAGDPTRQQFEEICDYVAALEVAAERLVLQNTSYEADRIELLGRLDRRERMVAVAQARADDAEAEAEDARRDARERDAGRDVPTAGAAAAGGMRRIEAIPPSASIRATPRVREPV